MDAKERREALEAHCDWCADKMEKSREAIGDALVAVSDKNGNVGPNPAFAPYLQLAKEFRSTTRQLMEMGEEPEEEKSSLASLRLVIGNKQEAV